MTRPEVAFWALLAATAAVFLAMAFWSVPRLEDHASGDLPFDVRLLGYSYEEARDYLARLGREGRIFYLNVQWRLDSVFPALLALTLGFALPWLYPGAGPWGRAVLIVLAYAGAVFDYVENYHIASMMIAGPDLLTQDTVAAASRASILKWVFDGLAFMVCLIGVLRLVSGAGRRRKRSVNS